MVSGAAASAPIGCDASSCAQKRDFMWKDTWKGGCHASSEGATGWLGLQNPPVLGCAEACNALGKTYFTIKYDTDPADHQNCKCSDECIGEYGVHRAYEITVTAATLRL